MHGLGMGTLKLQASQDPDFIEGVEDVVVQWDFTNVSGPSFTGTSISGQQHTNGVTYGIAVADSYAYGTGLKNYVGKRFYLRLHYTAGITHLGDCAVDTFSVQFAKIEELMVKNSFKVMHPTYDDHNRPSAVFTRDGLAKRPVNIRNIHMTGNSPTVAGNYLDRYEYVSVVSPEANDPYFVKNNGQITQTTMRYTANGIENVLKSGEGSVDGRARLGHGIASGQPVIYSEFTLPDRTFLTSSVRNRTRIRTRFSSPGGFETLSRGFLDPAHEALSPHNAMTFRNAWPRKVYNSQLQAHCGRFGASKHSTATARVYGSEAAAKITADSYELTGDASKHKYHRNNIERFRYTGSFDYKTDGEGFDTISRNDNAFVSHMIPRTDQQTRWITASII